MNEYRIYFMSGGYTEVSGNSMSEALSKVITHGAVARCFKLINGREV